MPSSESCLIPELDLLSLNEVTMIPGVRRKTGPLPKPFMDLSKYMRKGEKATTHQYWLRSQITEWLSEKSFGLEPQKQRSSSG